MSPHVAPAPGEDLGDRRLREAVLDEADVGEPAVTYNVSMPLARVLVVDDEPAFLDMVTEVLTVAGYEVATAATAGDALMFVQLAAPDVILLDIAMPGMDGVTALQRLHALKPDVPIIMLTANTDEQVGRTALRWGAFDYIPKPFDSAHLVRVVEAAIAHRGG